MASWQVGDDPLTEERYWQVVLGGFRPQLGSLARRRMAATRRSLERQLDTGVQIYSVNTGYGADNQRVIPLEAIAEVQHNTLLSHAQGVGPPVAETIVRGMLLLKANEFAQGHAGVRAALADKLLDMLKTDILPEIPSAGSLTASGDLIPHAHLGLALVGRGAVRVKGRRRSAAAAMRAAHVKPYSLAAKEGVALTNGTAFALAHGLELVRRCDRLLEAADLAVAISLQGIRGHLDAFDERLVQVRPHPGAMATAARIRRLSAGGKLFTGADGPRRHDPYCWRCVPQVHGAARDALIYARGAVGIELNSTGDNPIIDVKADRWLSGGNFHGQPLALPFDHLALALTTIGAISQRRIAQLMEGLDPNLPPKLTKQPTTRLGLVMTATSALSLVALNRSLTHPASADSSGTDDMEDHTSMAAIGAQKALTIAENVALILAIELVAGAQAVEFQGIGLASRSVRTAISGVRRHVAMVSADRSLTPGLESLAAEILDGRFPQNGGLTHAAAHKEIPPE
jgi:histidine ammonia-lyase